MRPIVWTEPWYRDAHNNVRHANLLSRFNLVDSHYQYRSSTTWQGRAHQLRSRSGYLGRTSRHFFDTYWRIYAKKIRARLQFSQLNREYKVLLCTSDHLHQVTLFKGLVVVDDDDPIFSKERLAILNRPNVAAVVTTSEQLKARLLKEGLRKDCYIIPSGVDFSSIEEERVKSIGSKYRASADEIVIGYMVPRIYIDDEPHVRNNPLTKLQSISYILSVMNRVWAQKPNVKLWLIGKPSDAVEAAVSREPRVRLIGYIPEQQILNFTSNFDIGVYPRVVDVGGRHSIKLLQYMACGVPIVSTDVSEAHMVKEASSGMICKDESSFANALITLIEQPKERIKLAANGESFARGYSWGSLAEKYEQEVFLPVLQKRLK